MTIKSPKDLALWRAAWDNKEKESVASQIFHPSLLLNPDIRFVALIAENSIIAGAVLNIGPIGVLGISNLFGRRPHQQTIISSAIRTYPEHTIVTYESKNTIAVYKELGFITAGSLVIWYRKEDVHKSQD